MLYRFHDLFKKICKKKVYRVEDESPPNEEEPLPRLARRGNFEVLNTLVGILRIPARDEAEEAAGDAEEACSG